ncbi:hypothetical protein MUO71_08495 [Candidatus Bathyarchaeota archaeon]|nr:hypothetical protein [Candidatus Bathyarchaeota archaeon]
MIITSNIAYDSLKSMLSKGKRTGIVACDSCSSACDTGGRKKLDEITIRLKEDGYDVVCTDLFPMPCNVESDQISGFDVDEFLILACDAAVNTFQMLFPSKKIISGLNTIGIGAKDAQGNIFIIKDLKK